MKTDNGCQDAGIRVKRQQLAPGFVQQVQQRDDRCVAPGKVWKPNCADCPKKTETEKIELTIDVTPGMRHGDVITFEGVTDERPGMKPGDLHFIINEEPNDYFHRQHDDLYKTIEIPLVDALVGFSRKLVHLDDHEFVVTVDDVTECDHVLRVPGKGMPRRHGRGHGSLYITFDVDFPDKLSESQKETIRKVLADVDGRQGDEL